MKSSYILPNMAAGCMLQRLSITPRHGDITSNNVKCDNALGNEGRCAKQVKADLAAEAATLVDVGHVVGDVGRRREVNVRDKNNLRGVTLLSASDTRNELLVCANQQSIVGRCSPVCKAA